ncbi:MAG: hypothetical protein ACFFG0_00850 [Candidatus Thorarchaeota archaeon]
MKEYCEICSTRKMQVTGECECSQLVCRLCKVTEREDGSPFCINCNGLSIWGQLKFYINKHEVGETIKRQNILNVIGHGYTNTIDLYTCYLRKLQIIQSVNPGLYLKRKDIPEKLTVRLLVELTKTWKGWFIPLEEI